MNTKLSRRSFGKHAILAAGAIAAAPTVNSVSFLFPSDRRKSLQEIAQSIFYQDQVTGLFIATAAGPWLLVLRALGAAASIATIMDWLNIRPSWAYRPDYSNAGGCTGNCQAQEAEMRRRGVNTFSAVHRAPQNHNFAVMAGHHVRSAYYNEAAIQYDGGAAINIRGRETEAVRAATEVVGRSNKLSRQRLAQAVAITGKRPLPLVHPNTGEKVNARVFDTALGGYIIDNPRHPHYSGGVVAVHAPGLTDYDRPALVGVENG